MVRMDNVWGTKFGKWFLNFWAFCFENVEESGKIRSGGVH